MGAVAFKNIFGAVIGAVFGHLFYDRPSALRARRDLFFEYVCMAVAKLAKIDGVVSQAEIDAVERLFREFELDGEAREKAIDAFRAAKISSETAADITARFAADFSDADSRHVYMLALCKIAVSDGELSGAEVDVLEQVADILRVDLSSYIRFRRGAAESGGYAAGGAESGSGGGSAGGGLDSAYEILGVSPSASDDEIKTAYRNKCKQLHPDVLKHKGLGDFAIKVLEDELSRVNSAYETIKKYRQ